MINIFITVGWKKLFLKNEYLIPELDIKEILENAQNNVLYTEIEKKTRYKKLCDSNKIEQIDIIGIQPTTVDIYVDDRIII